MSDLVKHNMYYVAIVCPAEVNEKILPFKYWMKEQFGCIVALKSPAHITLIPPFWLEQTREAELQQALQSLAINIDETEINLQGFSHFNKRVLFINIKENPQLKEIKKQAEEHFIQMFPDSIKADDRAFHPHVTIANRDLRPSDFLKAWEHFAKKDFKEIFRTGTISLLKLEPDKWNVIGEKNW
jgi:2'-5' RNA ligase